MLFLHSHYSLCLGLNMRIRTLLKDWKGFDGWSVVFDLQRCFKKHEKCCLPNTNNQTDDLTNKQATATQQQQENNKQTVIRNTGKSAKKLIGLEIVWYCCNRVFCRHVPGHDPLIFSFLSFILFDWVGVLWPQLSKVLKVVCWAGSVPFPPVSLQRQVVCLLLRPVFMFSSQGRALQTVSWLVGVQIKVML